MGLQVQNLKDYILLIMRDWIKIDFVFLAVFTPFSAQ